MHIRSVVFYPLRFVLLQFPKSNTISGGMFDSPCTKIKDIALSLITIPAHYTGKS